MFGECHAHLFMNGWNYHEAVKLHRHGPQEADIREKLRQYREQDVLFVRDGGDALGVSALAKRIAPEYGITYRTPLFAIHKNGHYGGIVGFGFDDMREYHALVKRAIAEGADFIKVMFSGIMDFSREGALTEEPLDAGEIREMIHIAHGEGMAVMAHVNGADAVRNAVEAGVDSVEHGNFMDDDCLQALAESHAVWVPTYVTITNMIGNGRFDDGSLRRLAARQGERIRRGFVLGVKLALGSDAGAFCVPHAKGIVDEYNEFRRLAGCAERKPGCGEQSLQRNAAPVLAEQCIQRNAAPVLTEQCMQPDAAPVLTEQCMQPDAAPVPAERCLELDDDTPVLTGEELDARLAAAEQEIRTRFSRYNSFPHSLAR